MGTEQIGRTINDKDRISTEEAKFYSEIDGLVVIEELLHFKGLDVVDQKNTVSLKRLEEVAHIHYRLKCGATNKLYVGYFLDRFYRRHELKVSGERVSVPQDILDKVKAEEARFKAASATA